MAAAEEKRALSREEFLRGTAGLAAAGTGMGLLVPSALASGQAKKGGTLHLVYTDTSAAETSDPTVQTGIAVSQPALNNTYDRLTYIVPGTWAVLPRLAVSWKASADAKTWTFKLRKGVKFHNGKPLTSKDVAWSYRHILDKKNGSSAYARLSGELDPAGIKTPDPLTVVFHLTKGDAQFPIFAGTYQTGIYPDGTDPKKTPIGTGPFMLKSWKPTLGWEMVRNPHYWVPGLPYLDSVRAVYIAGAKQLLAAAGHSSGIDITITTADVYPGIVDQVAALKSVLAPAGINVNIDKVPTDTFWGNDWLHKPAFTSYWNHRHPKEILELLYRSHAAWNEGKFYNPKLDALIDAGA